MDAVINDLCVKDTFCYTVGGGSFRIYNCADPTQPTQVGAASDGGEVIVEANGYAYVGGSSGSGLNVYDVHDPANPTLVNTLGGVQLAMFTRGHLLMCVSEQPAYFSIRDVSDPHSIHEVGRIDGYGGLALFADDKYAYLSCSYEHDGLFVFDISDSSHPRLRDSINPEGLAEWDCYVPHSPGYGYLADDYGGLITLDLHDPYSISQVWAGYQAHLALDVVVDDQRVYLANECAGLQILDVSDPTEPVSLGRFDTVGSKETNTATARDSFAFSGMSGITGRRFLRVLDVLDPSNPTLVAQESCYNPPEDYVLRDSLLYVAENYMFQIFNVARPREPDRMGNCGLPSNSYNLDVEGSMAYVANIFSLQMVNVAHPDSPYVVGTWPGKAAGVDVVDTVAYVGSIDYFLASLNVKNPASPQVIDTLNLGDAPTDVRVVGSRAYVSGGSNWVKVIDASDPATLKLKGTWFGPGWNRRLEYAAPYLYAACSEAGVCVLESVAVGVGEQRVHAPRVAGLSFAPNPTRGRVEVRLPAGADGWCEWEVCNVAGRVVNAGEWRTAGHTLRLNLRSEPAGVYVVTCRTPSGTGRGRIVTF
jgi:hypothetical protein